MSAIGPGDWVECVDASPETGRGSAWPPGEELLVGVVYQVADTFVAFGKSCVSLSGRERTISSCLHGRRVGYLVARFRPIYRPKADLIESLKTPAKREGVPA